MDFVKYHSISNMTEKNINELKETIPEEIWSTAEWVAVEKIHGANFSFIVQMVDDNVELNIAKRTDLIAEDENFFKAQIIREKYRESIIKIYAKIKAKFNLDDPIVQIYGELFGGYYPGVSDPNKNHHPVQKGVYYNPEIDFMVFDIKMNFVYLAYDEVIELTNGLMQCIPVHTKGKFDELIKLNPYFVSTIPKLYGLPEIENNMAEGFVIKLARIWPTNKTRPILKIKNFENFGEVKNPTKVFVAKSDDSLVEVLMNYFTQNRLDTLISKIGIDNPHPKIVGLLINDMIKDYEATLELEDREVFKKVLKQVKLDLLKKIFNNTDLKNWIMEHKK